jgi:hypothetical protein
MLSKASMDKNMQGTTQMLNVTDILKGSDSKRGCSGIWGWTPHPVAQAKGLSSNGTGFQLILS